MTSRRLQRADWPILAILRDGVCYDLIMTALLSGALAVGPGGARVLEDVDDGAQRGEGGSRTWCQTRRV